MEETIGYEALFSAEDWDEIQRCSPPTVTVKGYPSGFELTRATLGVRMEEVS